MNDAELEQLLDDIESDRAERTESTTDGDKFRQAVCAFANDLPDHRTTGVLFVGVNNKGEPTGIKVTDQLLQNLASIRGDGNVLPFPSLDVQKRMLKGQDVAVVLVHPSSATPVRYKGTIWIRTGPRRGIANPDDERRLNEKRRFRDLPPDIRPIESAGLDALDELLFHLATCSVSGSASSLLAKNSPRTAIRSSSSRSRTPTSGP
ncbi:MAG: helix-turn-helix domain-containing protein [Isosphaerales bacterium]